MALEGYSEKTSGYTDRGNLFIKDRADWQSAVPYKYQKTGGDQQLTIGDDSVPGDMSKYTTFKKN
jgi:hypothetical protein